MSRDQANDEIFQGNTPVLVGVDPVTTFTYLLQQAETRDSTTWGVFLLEKQEKQLNDKTKQLQEDVMKNYKK